MSKKKILIIRFSSIGDVILSTPIIRSLKLQISNSEVHYCTSNDTAFLVENNPYVDKVFQYETLYPLIQLLKPEDYDYIIDLQNDFHTKIIKWRLGVRSISPGESSWKKWLMTKFKIQLLPNKHIVERYLEALEPLNIKTDDKGLDYFIPDRDEVEEDWLPESHRKYYVVYAISGDSSTKKLPLKKMIQLCDTINKPIILIGNKEDKSTAAEIENFFTRSKQSGQNEKILEKLNKKALIFNACGLFNFNQFASIIKRAGLVFTHDNEYMHVSAALKKEIFTIWGNTVPGFGKYPYKTKFSVLENKDLGCRPCSQKGFDSCPKKHFKCMNDIVFNFYLP
ncbi:glycosyltransferase family 9 protein [Fulvivirgaceae bacterium BMA10]|uniref:Glycosyltransferase family 9 protein n=1 Tax=Splendidivirga corallicola TaxID=3051826 RepID=A0ABT8KM77_9BACT|nr:glycosyltransferase family 9 protein [Fulvivirgaceae bacterium BMA10]